MPIDKAQTKIIRILSEVSDALEGGASDLRYLARRVTPVLTSTSESTAYSGTRRTKNTERKAAFVFTKETTGTGKTETVQLAVPIAHDVSRWFRHYALDQGLSMAELIRRILRDFMAAHGGPAE